ncbi:hypothetical protein KY361_02090 [Candidatus Woesearchaeota archaeon]|nr:hypothetical protein [Candidatus Woesearchaeota archaeon]
MVSRAYNLEGFAKMLESWGLTDVMLPFLLIFVIIFAVLEKTKLFGEEKRNINTVLALVFALLVVIPHVTHSYPAGFDVVQILNDALPAVSLVIVGILMLLVLIGIFGQEKVFLGMTAPGWITFISILLIIGIFGNAAGWWASGLTPWLERNFGSDAIAIIIMLLVFGVIIAWITGGEGKREELGAWKRMGVDWSRLFGGGK